MKKRPAARIKGWAPPPATAPYCARLTPCPYGTCAYRVACDSQTLQPPRP